MHAVSKLCGLASIQPKVIIYIITLSPTCMHVSQCAYKYNISVQVVVLLFYQHHSLISASVVVHLHGRIDM